MNPLAVFSGPYALLAKWGVIAFLAVSFGTYAWVKGNEHGSAKLDAYIRKQAVETLRVGQARDKVTQKVVIRYIKTKGDTEIVTQFVDREVVKYAEFNSGYCLDPAWRVLHNAATGYTVPDAAKPTDGTSGAPRAAEALETITKNYGAAKRNADKLTALQEWVLEQQKVK